MTTSRISCCIWKLKGNTNLSRLSVSKSSSVVKMFSTDTSDTKPLNYGTLRKKKAEDFMKNLDVNMMKKKDNILALFENLKQQHSFAGIDVLTCVDLHYLLTECDSDRSVKKYLRERSISNVRKIRRQKKVQKNEDEKPASRELSYTVRHDRRAVFLKNWSSIRPALHGQPLIFDLDFDLTRREQNRSVTQLLSKCYADNYNHSNGFHLHFTGIKKHQQIYEEYQAGILESYVAEFYERPFWEIFPLENLIYLTPDAPSLNAYNGNSVYIIGGFENIDGRNHSCFARAKSLGIRAGSFPLMRYGRFTGKKLLGRNLQLDYVLNILLNVNLSHSWRKAIRETLPADGYLCFSETFQRRR